QHQSGRHIRTRCISRIIAVTAPVGGSLWLTVSRLATTMNSIQRARVGRRISAARWDVADNEFGLRYWQDARISRRRLLGGVAVGGASLAAIGLVGCSSGKKSTSPSGSPTSATDTLIARTPTDGSQDGKPTHLGGILRVQQNPAWPNMDPFGPGINALVQGLALGFTVFDHMWYVP